MVNFLVLIVPLVAIEVSLSRDNDAVHKAELKAVLSIESAGAALHSYMIISRFDATSFSVILLWIYVTDTM